MSETRIYKYLILNTDIGMFGSGDITKHPGYITLYSLPKSCITYNNIKNGKHKQNS